jgi:hypothetical protein
LLYRMQRSSGAYLPGFGHCRKGNHQQADTQNVFIY